MSLAFLKERAAMLGAVRSFFQERRLMEVDCCALVPNAPLDSNVEVMTASVADNETGYLHTSPEYAMKRLLSAGSGDIYYLGHVFRKGEIGRLHNPEFAMIEWYRVGMNYGAFIEEACDLISLFLGPLPVRRLGYRDAFLLYANLDPFEEFDGLQEASRLGVALPQGAQHWDKDTWLHLFLSHAIEPRLGEGELTVLCEYPPSQAALARLFEQEGRLVAKRFEIYHRGIELSNGYCELTCAKEQRRRFEEENRCRRALGKESYALDERFLAALERGLPDCCGASVGFDRLLLLKLGQTTLSTVLPFAWNKEFFCPL